MATATYVPIATVTSSSNGPITFSSIPNTYTDLRLVLVGTVPSGLAQARFSYNGASTNFSGTSLEADGSSASSASYTSGGYITVGTNNSELSTTIPGLVTLDVFSYAGSTYKTCLATMSSDLNGSGGVARTVNLWQSTAAITSITCTSNGGGWKTGTTATLWGI